MKNLWINIKASHVNKAIEEFNASDEKYPKARNTFLIYDDRKYPAKHIRSLSYKIANKKEIGKQEFSGGQETVDFFINLGFDVEYKGKIISTNSKKKMLRLNRKPKQVVKKHKIVRLVITKEQCVNEYGDCSFEELEKLLERFVNKFHNKYKFDFLVTPGGFVNFEFPKKMQIQLNIENAENNKIEFLKKSAEKDIAWFFKNISKKTLKKLRQTVKYFTIGIDGFNDFNQLVELVAIYDFDNDRIINWTGKFYPTEGQRKNLIKVNDLSSHFIELNHDKILILGCHDLSVYNPRGQATAKPNGWKSQKSKEFRKLCKEFKPNIVIQHPHLTDTPKTWNLSWKGLEKELSSVEHFVSGIKYFNPYGENRDTLKNVLEKTKKGDIIDFK